MVRNAVITLAMFAVSVATFVWSMVQFSRAETAYHAGWLITSGSVWFVDLAFTCAVLIDTGRHWVLTKSHPKVVVAPPEDEQTVLFTSRPVLSSPGYVPMSQRPDPITLVDLPTARQRIENWTPPANGS